MAWARFGDRVCRGLAAVTHDAADLASGFWGVVVTFEGALTAVRFESVERVTEPEPATGWTGLEGAWRTSLDEAAYRVGVERIRELIAAGTVYQVNLCRILAHPLPEGASVRSLGARLARGNPAPHACTIDVPEAGVEVACASPEAYLLRRGDLVRSRPIKGTADVAANLLAKDVAENVMIVDLVRNDLAHVCRPGTIAVDRLCTVDPHPGLVHLTSEVSGRLRPDVGWHDLLAATFPPGSVSGAPKHTALETIRALEPLPRGPYCGAVGWVDGDRGEAALSVGIRTFWVDRSATGTRELRFGTGAGITWPSDPEGEWVETRLKASRLVGLTSGRLAP